MRAVVYHGPNDMRLEEVPEPVLRGPEDAIVRVTAASICGSDLHVLHGLMPQMNDGAIIGHEFVGVVEAGGRRRGGLQAGRPRGGRRRPSGAAAAAPARPAC